MKAVPGYWMYEQSGILAPVVKSYLNGEALELEQIMIMRAYLRQWMNGPWRGDGLDALREQIDQITNRTTLDAWFKAALDQGIDPL